MKAEIIFHWQQSELCCPTKVQYRLPTPKFIKALSDMQTRGPTDTISPKVLYFVQKRIKPLKIKVLFL
jgi:hypothetical protein